MIQELFGQTLRKSSKKKKEKVRVFKPFDRAGRSNSPLDKSGEKSTGRDLLRYRRHRIASNRSIIKLSLSARGRMGAMKGAYWALGFKGLFSV
jgi:hypothetical protein